jgi:hypothetical protein
MIRHNSRWIVAPHESFLFFLRERKDKMRILKFRIFATALLISVGVLLLCSFSSCRPKAANIQAYCKDKATQASDKCIGAGMDAAYCADIANRTYNNCIQRLTGRPPTMDGNRLPPPSPSGTTPTTVQPPTLFAKPKPTPIPTPEERQH